MNYAARTRSPEGVDGYIHRNSWQEDSYDRVPITAALAALLPFLIEDGNLES